MPNNENTIVNETILTGKKYRVLKDKVHNLWNRISFWTSANDVEFTDSGVLQGKRLNEVVLDISNGGGMPTGTIATFDGTTLPPGFEPYTTAEQTAIQEINDKLTTLPGLTQVGTTGVFYRVYNRIVEIFIATPNISVSNSGTKIATLPNDVPKPPRNIIELAGNILNPSSYSSIQVSIYPSGNISASNYATITTSVQAHIIYLA